MRINHFIPTVLILLTSTAVQAQDAKTGEDRLATYIFDASAPVFECDFNGVIAAGAEPKSVPRGSMFTYIDEKIAGSPARSVITFQFLDWDRRTEPEKFRAFNGDPDDLLERRKTFCVEKSAFDRTAARVYKVGRKSWDLAAGVLLLPIKLRFGGHNRDLEFSKDVTLGTVVGPRYRLSGRREVYGSILGGAGITAVTLDDNNTDGVITESTDRAAVTFTAGTMLEVSRFQIGAMVGWDWISQPNQTDWRQQGKPWLSIGLGYALLSAPPASPVTQNK